MKTGWQQTTLGAVAQVGAGNSAPQGETHFSDGVYPFFRTSDAGRIRFGDITKSTDKLNEKGIEGLRKFPAGTILFPKSGASTFLNHRVMMAVDGYVSSHLATIVGDESKVDRRFLLYFLGTVSAQDLVQDHAYPSLNLPLISGIPIFLPPLPEQHRIVALLDEAFNGIATARANAEKNLHNARAVFESHLQSVFTKRGEGWVETTLGQVYDVRDGTHDSPKFYDEGFPLVTSKNLKRDGLNLDSIKFISEEDYRKINERSGVSVGDVLFAMIGTIGNPTVVKDEPKFAIKNMALFKVPKSQSSEFLRYFLSADVTLTRMKREANGTTQKFVGLGYLRKFPIHLPTFHNQQKLVDELDRISAETVRLESLYQRKLAALDELKQSLLHQAFSGQL